MSCRPEEHTVRTLAIASALVSSLVGAACDEHLTLAPTRADADVRDSEDAESQTPSESFVELVNTARGSDSTVEYSHGNTFPATALPNGFNLWTPVTEANSKSWLYEYASKTIQGFAVSHQPSPWLGDYGSFQIMPSTGGTKDRAAAFQHSQEITKPHYYSVTFQSGLQTEITPSEHGAVFRLTYPSGELANLLFSVVDEGSAEFSLNADARSVTGHVDLAKVRTYFYATIDHDISELMRRDGQGAALGIDLGMTQAPVLLRIATSFIGIDEARQSLERETGERSFEEVRSAAQKAWDSLLQRVEIEGASQAQRVTFYSSLYRLFLYPSSRSEIKGGVTEHFSPYVNDVRPGEMYVNNGFWDTYRAVWPLYTLLAPKRTGQLLRGILNAQRDGGWMPRWSAPGYTECMVGTHSDIVLADAYLRGIRDFDLDLAYESMLKNAMVYSDDTSKGRRGNERSIFRGYIPLEDLQESAAWYLEDRVNDYGIARIAQLRGDAAYASYFSKRAQNYVNLFSKSVGFFRGRHADGSYRTSDADFKPNEWGYEFTEGAPWHYVAAANHDPAGMMQLYGGPEVFAAKLDDVLTAPPDFLKGSYSTVIHEMREGYDVGMGQYAHPNEPVHHMLYMYDYAGQPWKTQHYVRQVLSEERAIYTDGVGTGRGYLGDEDNGEMSAWYVFSALGFFPASPGHDEYAIGSPLFPSATLHLDNGRTFTVLADNQSDGNEYIQSATLNGQPYDRAFLEHQTILQGGVLELRMGPTPSSWGSSIDAGPMKDVAPDSWDCAEAGFAASGTSNEGHPELAFDNDSRTAWERPAEDATLQYVWTEPSACQSTLYTITSAAGSPDADPRDWELEALVPDNGWTTLDRRTQQQFSSRQQTRVFTIASPPQAFTQLRLRVTANHGDRQTRIAEVELLRR